MLQSFFSPSAGQLDLQKQNIQKHSLKQEDTKSFYEKINYIQKQGIIWW